MIKYPIVILFAISVCLLTSCKGKQGKGQTGTTDSLSIVLTEQRLGDSRFYLSLPNNYSIEVMNAADFVVYYFNYNPYDTAAQKITSFRGGIYFGNHPSPKDPEGCVTELREARILGQPESWHVSYCDTVKEYSASVLYENKDGEDWQEYIHAFGVAATSQGIDSLLYVFATLRKE